MGRLTWAAGPPDRDIRDGLEALCQKVGPDFNFAISNFCVSCSKKCKSKNHRRQYEDFGSCETCEKFVELWRFAPWAMKNDKLHYYNHFQIQCLVCNHNRVTLDDCKRSRSCQKCRSYCCSYCYIRKCDDCKVVLYGRKGEPSSHICDNGIMRWKHFLESVVVSYHIGTRHDRFILVFIRDGDASDLLLSQVWVVGDYMSLVEIGKLLTHKKSNRSAKVDLDTDFIFWVDDEPKTDVPLEDQIIKRVSLRAYLEALPE